MIVYSIIFRGRKHGAPGPMRVTHASLRTQIPLRPFEIAKMLAEDYEYIKVGQYKPMVLPPDMEYVSIWRKDKIS